MTVGVSRAFAQAAALPEATLRLAEAKTRLGLKDNRAFYRYVTQGQIRRYALPGSSLAVYSAADIEHIAEERRLASFQQSVTPVGLCTWADATQQLAIPQGTLAGWVRAGKIRAVQLPDRRHPLYLQADIDALKQHPRKRKGHSKYAPDVALSEVYTHLYAQVWPRVVPYLQYKYQIPHEEAEDIAQQTFLNIWRDGSAFFTDFPTFVAQQRGVFYRARQQAASEQRARHVRQEYLVHAQEAQTERQAPSVEEQVLVYEQVRQWWRRSGLHLPHIRRLLLLWYVVMGLSYEEMQDQLRQRGVHWSLVTLMKYCQHDARLMQHQEE